MEGTLLVEIRRDGLRLAGQVMKLPALAAQIGEKVRESPDRKVVVRPDKGVVLQDTVAVLDALAAAGVHDLSLVRKTGR